jgi:hypothetical protein
MSVRTPYLALDLVACINVHIHGRIDQLLALGLCVLIYVRTHLYAYISIIALQR